MLYYKRIYEDSVPPRKAHDGDAGWDVCNYYNRTVLGHSRMLIDTGLIVYCNKGHYVRVAPRSGLSVSGIDIGAGVVDSGYRGHLKILVINNSDIAWTIEAGSKIAQLIVEKCDTSLCDIQEVKEESKTKRGTNGFGSTDDDV